MTAVRRSIGRPSIRFYPFNCEFCGELVENNNQFFYHTNRYKHCPNSKGFIMSEKRLKADLGFTVIQFNPLGNLSPSLLDVLNKIKTHIVDVEKIAVSLQQVPATVIAVSLPDWLSENFPSEKLMALNTFINQKIVEFSEKQATVRDKVDELLEEGGQIIGRGLVARLYGEPPQYQLSMEKLVVNHIRQRRGESLEKSYKFVEAVYLSVKQTEIFTDAEEEMAVLTKIGRLINSTINSIITDAPSFVHREGELTTPRAPSGASASASSPSFQ